MAVALRRLIGTDKAMYPKGTHLPGSSFHIPSVRRVRKITVCFGLYFLLPDLFSKGWESRPGSLAGQAGCKNTLPLLWEMCELLPNPGAAALQKAPKFSCS